MKILIVDDEPLARMRLQQLLQEMPEQHEIEQAGNGMDALAMLRRERFDLLLLDIRMPGMDGIELARHVQQFNPAPAVVFTTAYSEHALEAFDVQAVNYLLKPVKFEQLESALKRAGELSSLQISELALATDNERQHICARIGNDVQLIALEDVYYFRAEQKYVTVRHANGEVLIEDSLSSLEQEWGGRFMRVHRNALVAPVLLDGLHRTEGGQAYLGFRGIDDKIDVSRRHLPAVRAYFRAL